MYWGISFRFYVVTLLCGIAFLATVSANAAESEILSTSAIIQKMQAGGLVLYVRHGATDKSQSDSNVDFPGNCETERNLSPQGKEESIFLREVFNDLNIKVEEVLTSPYCRCLHTAELAFGKSKIVKELSSSSAVSPDMSKQFKKYLLALLSTPIDGKGNLTIVSHTANLRETTGIWPKPEGVIHVFQPHGSNRYTHLGFISPESWAEHIKQ